MDDMTTSRLWLMRGAYIGLSLLIIFVSLLPLGTLPQTWAGPDLLIALVFCWALRRPDYVPVLSIAAVMLLADLMFLRPPGLMAALVVLGTEQLKNRAGGLRNASFLGEWIAAGMVVIAVVLMNRIILAILVVDQAPIGLTLIQMLMTIAVYPVVVLISHLLLGVRKLAPGAEDAMAGRT
jgi:rod shape-determining protein MreD